MWTVNRGLDQAAEQKAVARMLGWVMDGEIYQSLPDVKEKTDESQEFWSARTCTAWKGLLHVLKEDATTATKAYYTKLSRNSVCHHFLSENTPKENRGFRFPVANTAITLLLLISCWWLINNLPAWPPPSTPTTPYEICPMCEQDSLLFASLEDMQEQFGILRAFEETRMPGSVRESHPLYKVLARPVLELDEESAQQLVLNDVKEYFDNLTGILSSLKKTGRQGASAMSTSDAACIQKLAKECELHLYYVIDAIKSLAARKGIGVGNEYAEQKSRIAECIESIETYHELSAQTRTAFQNM